MQALLQVSISAVPPKARLQSVAVDPGSGIVSYQQYDCCVLFGIDSGFQFVKAAGLPSAFVSVQQAKLGYIVHLACHRNGQCRPCPPFCLYPGRAATTVQLAVFASPFLTPQHHLAVLRICLSRTLIARITERCQDRKRQKLMACLIIAKLKSVSLFRLHDSSPSSGANKWRKIGHD
jgi:hypothetical protein